MLSAMADPTDWLETGSAALVRGDWEAARAAYEAAVEKEETAEALDGLARSLWWLGDFHQAMDRREKAFLSFRKSDPRKAARIALWLAGEYELAGNLPAANGWMSRAERMLRTMPEGAEHGWLALSRASLSTKPARAEELAREALSLAQRHFDPDLEIRSLGRIGLILVTSGRVDEGLAHLDEAMAAATAGEGQALETIGETCCELILALEVVGDFQRFVRWTEVVMDFMNRHSYGPLFAFCGTCCAEIFAASGDIQGAEGELTKTLRMLQEKKEFFRCANPAAKLSELRILQGRYMEAERLISAYPTHPANLRPRIELAIVRGEHRLAESLLQRALQRTPGQTLLAVPYLARLVKVRLLLGDDAGARASRDALRDIADSSEDARAAAEASLADSRLAMHEGSAEARTFLETAIFGFEELRLVLEAARARLLLVELLTESEPELAALEARAALRSLESAGADREADQAASILRSLDGTGRAGPKQYSGLTKRELEVLDLLGEGLTNSEIAERLFISTKTAGHHVSNVLMKLHLRSRTEAAVYSLRRLDTAGVG